MMKTRNIKIVYLKELRDTIRDRRTLIAMVIVPILLFPVLIIGFGVLTTTHVKKMQAEIAKVVVLGQQNAPELYQLVEKSKHLKIVQRTDPKQALTQKEIHIILEIPEEFELKVKQGASVKLNILFDAAQVRSNFAKDKLCIVLEQYKEKLLAQRLKARNIDQAILTPFMIEEYNIASKEKMAGMILGMILPYVVILMCLTGAMYPAIDLTAGEKERGTIETLLVSPAARSELVFGKFLTVFTASIITAILATTSMFITLALGPSIIPSELTKVITFTIQPGAILVMLLLLIPIAVIFSALLMSISIFAKSYKEAQAYISPLMIIVIIPAVIPMVLQGMELNALLVLVPIVNVSLVLKQIFTGMYNWGLIGLIFLSTAVYAGIALFVAVRLFQREEVLFRT